MDVVVKKKNTVVVSERDAKIVYAYSIGKTTKEIAHSYKLSIRTVESVVLKLKRSFDCKSIIHLIATFLRNGTIK